MVRDAAHRTGAVPRIHPVILSGGAGMRLWPLSRASFPKQLLAFNSQRTMIQETAARLTGPEFTSPIIICNLEHRFVIAAQLTEIGIRPSEIVLETEGRNTAAAAVIASLLIAEHDPTGLVLLAPADHVIRDATALHRAISLGAAAAGQGLLVTFGTIPTDAATGYGYIRLGEAVPGTPGCFAVSGFREKPDLATAQHYLVDGHHLWNNGIFLFRADSFLIEMERFEPAIVASCRIAVAMSHTESDFRILDAEALSACKNISLDYAVMERTSKAAVVPVDIGWSDVGSWHALWELGAKDINGNVTSGDFLLEDVNNSYVRSDFGLVAVLGVNDLVVVATADAVLVAHRDRAQDVKRLVDRLQHRNRRETREHRRVHRPWGSYEAIDGGDGVEIKRLVLLPGARLAPQRICHQTQHWVVAYGIALVTCGGSVSVLHENGSITISGGAVHGLANPGESPLVVIVTQSCPRAGEAQIDGRAHSEIAAA